MPSTSYKKIPVLQNELQIKSAGFTLVETLLATAILTIAIVGALSLITQSTSLSGSVRNEHIAANLAQEGVELVHNIRNTNWVVDSAWNAGLGEGIYIVDPTISPVSLRSVASCDPTIDPTTQLFSTVTFMYSHDGSGVPTIFSRCITLISSSDADGIGYIRVQSTVSWSGGGQLTAEDHLYNWK